MNFIGRTDELKKLNKVFSLDEFTTSLIFGRRRVGKSELIKTALKKNSSIKIYYECKEVSEKSNVDGLSDILSEELNLPKLKFDNIESILKYIFELSIKEKIILVLDEYPYLKKTINGMDSILQALIDKYNTTSKLSLVILGSYVDIMKELLFHSNPLYGRVDLTIELKQMDYYDSSLFYPAFSTEDKIKIYSVFGGIPYYNRLIDDSKSVKENIIELIASNGARLENEVSMYLNSEISKIVNANEVFEALSKGFSKYSDILSQSHVSSGPTLVDVLDKLIRMDVVSKTSPINDLNNKKKCGYYISDNLSLFYYRYIFKYSSQMKIMDPNIFYAKYIEKDFEQQYVPHIFERICKQYLIIKNKNGEIDPVFEKIGKYYYDNPIEHTNGEFDVVTEDEKGYVFYEAKFRKNPITNTIIQNEIKQVNLTGLNCYKYVFISRSGFMCEQQENVQLIDLNEFYDIKKA
ncbi:predicted ATPase of the AAA superfamily [Firmicutes bacterium CAG:449]|nr:predicted ATPase of the AAA superfamily [Firmicutes bacterium CAG:449]